jgi:glycosyltransferase involved in cell wall biosynthesis
VPRSSPVALVHDYLLVRRGAERTFEAIAECWPEAPIYTLLYDPEGTQGRFAHRDVRPSHLQRLGVSQASFRRLLPAFPWAVRSLPLSGYELVVSSSSAFAHGVRPPAGGQHVCYCHSPFRYAWFERERAMGEVPRPMRPVLKQVLQGIRAADRAAARRVTRYVANSELTRHRIATLWNRDADVIHPPVEVERFAPAEPGRAFLVVGELVAHKRVELALEAARLARAPIRVVGEGPDRARLEARYGRLAGVEFLGRVDDAKLNRLYATARALVVPNVEEFGIAAVEAQAAGRPVVAAGAGGARETVIDGETGVLVPCDDARALARAFAETDFDRFDSERIVSRARCFSRAAFKRRLLERVEAVHDQGRPFAVPAAQAAAPAAQSGAVAAATPSASS